jgi:oxygen-independent coproporphyrinogen III oxidase
LSHCDISKEDKYVSAVCKEIEKTSLSYSSSEHSESKSSSRQGSNNIASTIYFGGGTPSLVKSNSISKIISALSEKIGSLDNIEITLECNPEDISDDKLSGWRAAGVNRLSIGVQSLNDQTRVAVNRKLTAHEVADRIMIATKYFENIGVDLISGLPNETEMTLLDSLGQLEALSINHISLYDLETDNDSSIGCNPDRFALPSDETSTEMLAKAWDFFEKSGYEQYEISNFARNSKYCAHNLDFWHGGDYLGFGLGATSRKGNTIFTNTNNFNEYLAGDFSALVSKLSEEEEAGFALLSAMRLNIPFKKQLERARGNTDIPIELLELKLVSRDYTLTKEGKLLYNQVVNKLI